MNNISYTLGYELEEILQRVYWEIENKEEESIEYKYDSSISIDLKSDIEKLKKVAEILKESMKEISKVL